VPAFHFRKWIHWRWPTRARSFSSRAGVVVAVLCNRHDADAWHSGLGNVGHSDPDQEYVCGETAGSVACQNQGVGENGRPLISLPLSFPHSRPKHQTSMSPIE
jgi:hypothetical protein